MPIQRIDEFPEGSGSLSNDDVFLFMDDPSGSGITKKISLSQISNSIGGGGNAFNIGNIDLHNGGTQSAQILQFNDSSKQSVITGPTPAENSNAQRLIIQGQKNSGVYEGGDVYVWGGDADTNGGDIKIYAGDADSESAGTGGYVNIDGGTGATNGGNIEITAGYSAGGQAGDIDIVGGPTSSGVAGDVNIKTNNSTNNWIFSPNGSFTLPNGNFIQSQAGQGETNIQIVDNSSPFKIYTNASTGAKEWRYDTSGNLTLPQGSILSETNNTLFLMPPTAQSGQSLVIRPTVATWILNSSGYIVYGSSITISVTLQSWAYFGTVNYTISGTGVTPQSLGRALTGKLTFVSTSAPDTETITWTIPANSEITEFTLTLTSVDGTRSSDIQTQNDPALYYNFEENGMPIDQFVTVTNDGMSNSEHSHIHLVAGDPSAVDIYLGDDDQYVKIEKNDGDVVIGTDNNNNHWTFNNNGVLQLAPSGLEFSDGTIQNTAASGLLNKAYGSFYDTTTQANISGINTMTFNNTDLFHNVSMVDNSKLTSEISGVFNIQFSAQLDKTDGGDDSVEIWISKNGNALNWTNTTVSMHQQDAKSVAAWNFLVPLNSGDYIQFNWYSQDPDVRILAQSGLANPTRPSIPSIILTAIQI